jgi:hypothetical protein
LKKKSLKEKRIKEDYLGYKKEGSTTGSEMSGS